MAIKAHNATCDVADRVTCGNCNRSWCERHDAAPSAQCHWCNGLGYSVAPWNSADAISAGKKYAAHVRMINYYLEK